MRATRGPRRALGGALVLAGLGTGLALGGAGPVGAQIGYPAPIATPATGFGAPVLVPTPYGGQTGAMATPSGGQPASPYAATGSATPYGGMPYGMPSGGTEGGAYATPAFPPAGGFPAVPPAAGAPVVSLPVTPLRLTDGPGTMDVLVAGAPAFSGYELVLTYEPQVVVVTGVSAGALASSTGASPEPTAPDLSSPGVIRFGVMLPAGAPPPAGDGVLARITFAPLAASEGSPVRLAEAAFLDANGGRVPAGTRDGTILVPAPPPPAAQTEAVAQATALALGTPGAGGPGAGLGLEALAGAVGAHRALLGWLTALGLGLAVAVLGWALGRRS